MAAAPFFAVLADSQ